MGVGFMSDGKVVVVTQCLGGMAADSYRSHFEMVKETLNSGNICGHAWGSPEHCACLDQVGREIEEIRKQILHFEMEENARQAGEEEGCDDTE